MRTKMSLQRSQVPRFARALGCNTRCRATFRLRSFGRRGEPLCGSQCLPHRRARTSGVLGHSTRTGFLAISSPAGQRTWPQPPGRGQSRRRTSPQRDSQLPKCSQTPWFTGTNHIPAVWVLWCMCYGGRIRRTLHAPVLPSAQNSARVVDPKPNSQDAPRASAATRRKQREGHRFPNRSRRKLHAPALPCAAPQNNERVVDSKQNSQHALAATRPKQRKGCRFEQISQDAPRASAPTRPKQWEGRRFQTKFAGRSTRQRCDSPKTAGGSSVPSRIRSTLHTPALPWKGFAGEVENAHGATTRALRHARSPQRVRTAPQRERFDTHYPRKGSSRELQKSHGATARALRHARSSQRVRRRTLKCAWRHSESASTRTKPAEGCIPPTPAKHTPG